MSQLIPLLNLILINIKTIKGFSLQKNDKLALNQIKKFRLNLVKLVLLGKKFKLTTISVVKILKIKS